MKKIDFSKLKLISLLKEILHKKPQAVFVTGIVGILILSVLNETLQSKNQNKSQASTKMESPDTVIPKGYVLVPIDLKNADSMSSLIEDFAIVDLYVASNSGKAKGQRVGHHLRLLRAPLNPNTFAVLVPDGEASALISGSGPLVAVIQNRDLLGHGSLDKNVKKTSHVQYYLGG